MNLSISIVGWLVIYFVSTRALKRAEITKAKDSCVECIEQVIEAIELIDNSEPKNLSSLKIESTLATLATRLEIKLLNLNEILSFEIIDSSDFPLKVRDIDCSELLKESSARIDFIEQCLDAIENIELSYRHYFYKMNLFQRILRSRHAELKGAFFGLLTLSIAFILLKIVTT